MAKHCTTCQVELPEGRRLHYCTACQRQREARRWQQPDRVCYLCATPIPNGRRSNKCRRCKKAMTDALRRQTGRQCPCGNSIPNGYISDYCPECMHQRRLTWVMADPEHARQVGRRWRRANPEKMQKYRRQRREWQRGGTVSQADRRAVRAAAGGVCQLCGRVLHDGEGHIDHVVPLSRGGAHRRENLQFLCAMCNGRKGAKLIEEVTARLSRQGGGPPPPACPPGV